MLTDPREVEAAFADTMLTGRGVVELLPDLTEEESVLAVRCDPDEVLFVWHTARSLVPVTGRWPVVMSSWDDGVDGDWLLRMAAERQRGQDVREQWRMRHGAPPAVDVPALGDVLAALVEYPVPDEYWEWRIDWELSITAGAFGSAPSADEARAVMGDRRSEEELDRWLLDWEQGRIAEGGSMPPAMHSHLGPFLPSQDCAVFLQPTSTPWDPLVPRGFMGRIYEPATLSAFLRSWHERFGAELVANWGTMLEFFVTRPPTSIDAAWQLAFEQTRIAPYTVGGPGISLRRHAQALVDRPTWFLHEHP